MSKPRILIAGAGIGGIVAALALLQKGFAVALYEQASELRELGAGVQISPNGSRVLSELGLRAGDGGDRLGADRQGHAPVTTPARPGACRTSVPMPSTRYGSPYWLVHRADFHAVLVQALRERAPDAVRVGARCIGFEQDADGVTPAAGERRAQCMATC